MAASASTGPVVVFGATGQIGGPMVTALIAAGFPVRVACRNPDAYKGDARAERVKADLLDPASLSAAVTGASAVVVSISPRKIPREPSTWWTTAGTNAIQAMKAAGVRRLFVVTSAGTVQDPDEPCLYRTIGRAFLKYAIADLIHLEDAVRTSGLDYTIIRPSRVINSDKTKYATAVDRGLVPGHGAKVTTGALAAFLVDELRANQFIGKPVAIASE